LLPGIWKFPSRPIHGPSLLDESRGGGAWPSGKRAFESRSQDPSSSLPRHGGMSGHNVPPTGWRLPMAFRLKRGKSRERRSPISVTFASIAIKPCKKLDSARITIERAGVYLTRSRGGCRGGATAERSRPATRLLSPNVSSRPGLLLDSLCARRPAWPSHPYRARPGLYTVETWKQTGEGTLSPLSFGFPRIRTQRTSACGASGILTRD
jgi:hypothetical protein